MCPKDFNTLFFSDKVVLDVAVKILGYSCASLILNLYSLVNEALKILSYIFTLVVTAARSRVWSSL